jgi:poly(A) polymerase
MALVYTSDEHKINAADVDRDAVYITNRLQMEGFETYIVGGAVRDLILGKRPKDFDIATQASPPQIKRLFRNARIIGRRFRLVHISYGPKIIEVATFRSITYGTTGNSFGTINDDVRRRDFTVNALFYDPQKQVVIDYNTGVEDLFARRLKPIIPLNDIFVDDPVRLIRAVKYSAALDLSMSIAMRWRIKKDAPLLKSISPSRLSEEISKILHSRSSMKIIN